VVYIWVRDGNSYTLTCAAPESRWSEWEPEFLCLALSFCWTNPTCHRSAVGK
jgi:hypothetical protein